MEEADREADRELVEADRDPKREQGQTAAACELADLLALVFFLVQEHPDAEQGEDGDRDVLGGAADDVPERMAEQKSDDRHRHLEARHHQADAKALPLRQSAHPKRGRDRKGVEPEREDEEDQLKQSCTRLAAGVRPSS